MTPGHPSHGGEPWRHSPAPETPPLPADHRPLASPPARPAPHSLPSRTCLGPRVPRCFSGATSRPSAPLRPHSPPSPAPSPPSANVSIGNQTTGRREDQGAAVEGACAARSCGGQRWAVQLAPGGRRRGGAAGPGPGSRAAEVRPVVGARVPRQARALVPTWEQARAARREMGLGAPGRRTAAGASGRGGAGRCSSPLASAEPFLRLWRHSR